MQKHRTIRELSDEELEGVIGSKGHYTQDKKFSVGTSVVTTASAEGNHTNYVHSTTQSGTVANSKAGISYAIGFALAMAI
jgi:hypothetical protein